MAGLVATVLGLLLLLCAEKSDSLRLYPHPLTPSENPDFVRYNVSHPNIEVFEPVPQFATLRTLTAKDSTLVNYTQLIKKYCLNPNTTLGRMIWPGDSTFLFTSNYADFVKYVADNGLYITSVHGFSPVSAGFWPPRKVLDDLETTLGSRWLGMANGEQDGHYFGAFIVEELPANNDRVKQYLNFREYFRGMESILGPKLTTLLSSTYPHYQLKTGLYTIAGAETSQHGPNAQLRYAFIRGAGKQYGVLWFGNVSIYNRFGHKVYMQPSRGTLVEPPKQKQPQKHNQETFQRNYTCSSNKTSGLVGDPSGPTCGTSLNLMKRLMCAQIMYNSGYVSFERGWFYESQQTDSLSPIGVLQHKTYLWAHNQSLFGTHVPTIALYLDFFNGWATPRQKHGYEYHVWYNLPYMEGDYLTDGVLRMIYPSYQDASYFHDETGVSSPTPYGDAMDVLLSDAPSWVLAQYDTLVVSSELTGGLLEVENTLKDYLRNGGNLVFTAGNLARLPGGSLGVTSELECSTVEAGAKIYLHNGEALSETYNMTVCDLHFPANCTILAKLTDSTPLAVQMPVENGGSLTVFATPFALSSSPVASPSSEVDVTLASPYPLLDHAQVLLNAILTNATLFTSTANLSLVPSYLQKDTFHVLVSNPELREQPMKLISPQGSITSMKEVPLDQSEKNAVGYLPDGFEGTDLGNSTDTTIAGGDTRLFEVSLSSDSLQFLPKVTPKPRPMGMALHLRHISHSIRHEILLRPTFFQHYDSVVVDYSYLITKDEEFLMKEGQWLTQQKVTVYVDASPSINLFPTLRLTNDMPELHNKTIQSLTSLLHKMSSLGSRDLIMSLHVFPSGQSSDQSLEEFNATLHYLSKVGSDLNITLHMLDSPKNPRDLPSLNRWLLSCNLASIEFVLNTARLVVYGYNSKYDDIITTRSSLMYVNAPGWDRYGINYADNVPLSTVNMTVRSQVIDMLKHVCSLRQCPYQSKNTKPLATKPRVELSDSQQAAVFAKEGSRQFKLPLELLELNTNLQGKVQETDMKKGPNSGKLYPLVMDAAYASQDEEFADVHFVETLLT